MTVAVLLIRQPAGTYEVRRAPYPEELTARNAWLSLDNAVRAGLGDLHQLVAILPVLDATLVNPIIGGAVVDAGDLP